MEIINRRQRMFSVSRTLRRANKTVGFVPTMGALHEGHLSLVKEARQRCDIVMVSIFVNPSQFNEKDDFEKYPRDLTADVALLAQYQVDYVFAPEPDEIYAPGFATYVDVEGLTDTLEGASRPGHFRGVATIVTILLNTIRADQAFFGQKDAQQVAVIKRLANDLGFETEIVVMPTVREESGLAMSSRNERLSPEDLERAVLISKGLKAAEDAHGAGEGSTAVLTSLVRDTLSADPEIEIDYIEAVDAETLEATDRVRDREVLLLVAAKLAGVRLIDNVLLHPKQ
jgi:pantoate--beta-alanine ligase